MKPLYIIMNGSINTTISFCRKEYMFIGAGWGKVVLNTIPFITYGWLDNCTIFFPYCSVQHTRRFENILFHITVVSHTTYIFNNQCQQTISGITVPEFHSRSEIERVYIFNGVIYVCIVRVFYMF